MGSLVQKLYRNPILPGFYPDPSICRVEQDYYLVNSSFICFPGIPIWHSQDLVHWRQIGHVLDRVSQVNLDGLEHSQGIFAPTIRWHEGLFYVVCTNVGLGGNFVVTAKDPAGPWSEPVWLADAPGIDPSLFFDDDGKAWYCGSRPRADMPPHLGLWEIWIQPFDCNKMCLTGEAVSIWRGALKRCIWPEGPHLYKHQGWYYLLHAEGGTELNHAVCMARSQSLTADWEGSPANPVLTHRHLGKNYPVINVGHADLVETQEGEWWLVCLGSRPTEGYTGCGRETFLVPAVWESQWLIAAPGEGRVILQGQAPLLEFKDDSLTAPDYSNFNFQGWSDHFDTPKLGYEWVMLRTPREAILSLFDRPGFLRLYVRPVSLVEKGNPSFVGIRQQHACWTVRTLIDFEPLDSEDCAGVAIVQNNNFQLRLEVKGASQDLRQLRLLRVQGKNTDILASLEVPYGPLILELWTNNLKLSAGWHKQSEPCQTLISGVDVSFLSTECAGGFVGNLIGLYACGPTADKSAYADFDWFEYRGADNR